MKSHEKIYKAAANAIFDAVDDSLSPSSARKLGLSDGVIRQLSELSRNGQKEVIENAPAFLSITFDAQELERRLELFLKKHADRELEDEFLLLHAPHKMMQQLFGIHATEFSVRRKQLGLGGQGKHRPYYCNGETENMIWEYWHNHKEIEIRQRYLKVAEHSGQPLSIIWAAVRRYDELYIEKTQ